jgi:HD-GYP domain-containing protein (c-di-GMP phosphodiesterase class II)
MESRFDYIRAKNTKELLKGSHNGKNATDQQRLLLTGTGTPHPPFKVIDLDKRQGDFDFLQRHYINRLEAIKEIVKTINSGLEPRLTLSALLEQIISHVNIDAADILLNTQYQILEFAIGYGFRSRRIEQIRVPIGEGLPGQAVSEKRVKGFSDLSKSDQALPHKDLLNGEKFVAYYAFPLIAQNQVIGVLEIYKHHSLEPNKEWFEYLEMLTGQTAIAIYNAELLNNLQQAYMELEVAYGATLEGWVRALDMRDGETEEHAQRVTEMTLRLAAALGIAEDDLVNITRGALLHDIGKMAIPDQILHKPGPLTDEEWQIMRKHPVYAYDLLSPISYLQPALDIPYYHHEHWDGNGYPRGLKSKEIPLAARIFAVVDVYDALRSKRPYRAAWDEGKVLRYIHAQSGKQFDPEVVEAFLVLVMSDKATTAGV